MQTEMCYPTPPSAGILLNVSLSRLPVLTSCSTYQVLKKPQPKEEEEEKARLRRSLWSLCPTYTRSHVPDTPAMPSPTGKAAETSACRARLCGGEQGSTATCWLITQSHLMKNRPQASLSHLVPEEAVTPEKEEAPIPAGGAFQKQKARVHMSSSLTTVGQFSFTKNVALSTNAIWVFP